MRGKEERENKFTERRQQDLMQPQSKAKWQRESNTLLSKAEKLQIAAG